MGIYTPALIITGKPRRTRGLGGQARIATVHLEDPAVHHCPVGTR